jgi:glycosyltransferase involved in cell wall biosynthesis
MTALPLARVDLHLHSRASNVADYYAARTFSLPESYSDPIALYHLLKKRGMSLITLTDHNSIDGVREMLDAGFEDVFISAEMTTTFPEDGCNIHVTVANMSEAVFREVNRLRPNVYEMVAYLEQVNAAAARDPEQRLAWFMTHPLMSTQNRPYGREGSLAVSHLEKALLLCECIEVQNGSRTRALNQLTSNLIRSLDRPTMERLANRHGIQPRGETPWRKAIVAGSDDHSGINPGRTWTEFAHLGPRPTPGDLIGAITNRKTQPAGAHGGPVTLAHSVLKLLYDGSSRRQSAGATRSVAITGSLQSLLRLVFDAKSERQLEKVWLRLKAATHQLVGRHLQQRGSCEPFEFALESEVFALLADAAFRSSLASAESTDDRIFMVVQRLANRIFDRYLQALRRPGGANLVGTIKQLVSLFSSHLFVTLPYLLSYLQQSSDCRIAGDIRKDFRIADEQKVVLVTDTFFEINGVSATIRRMVREAIRRNIDFTVVTCVEQQEIHGLSADPEISRLVHAGRLKIFVSASSVAFPEYDGLRIHFPPVLEMLRYLQESGCTKIQISTPGTVGLTGLLAAKLLQVESAATYHTSFPEYVETYTRDISLEAMAWKYMIVFYHAVDEVVVPSRYIARLLHKRGLRNRKLLILDRWVDVERFHPSRRVGGYWERHGLPGGESLVKFAYVGRVAAEKDLHLLAAAYRMLREHRPDAHLVIIGDGPYRQELQHLLAGLPVTFTGFLEGDELPMALASADVKLFPSTTDTWGNAPLEAQACGLPVVVSDIGGPAELMEDGVTGIRVVGRDVHGLHAAMLVLMNRETRVRMGRNARRFVEENRVDLPYTAILDADSYRRHHLAEKGRDEGQRPQRSRNVLDLASSTFELDLDGHRGQHRDHVAA